MGNDENLGVIIFTFHKINTFVTIFQLQIKHSRIWKWRIG